MKLNLPWLFLALSLICFIYVAYLIWLRNSPVTLSFSSYTPASSTSSAAVYSPAVLSIPELSLLLPVSDAAYTHQRWPVSSTGLIHLVGTPAPGDLGNSIVYGHNWRNLFGSLRRAKVGQKIYFTSSGQTKKFVISSIAVVSPQDSGLLQPSSDSRLTLYTCTGFLDSQRLVVTALLL